MHLIPTLATPDTSMHVPTPRGQVLHRYTLGLTIGLTMHLAHWSLSTKEKGQGVLSPVPELTIDCQCATGLSAVTRLHVYSVPLLRRIPERFNPNTREKNHKHDQHGQHDFSPSSLNLLPIVKYQIFWLPLLLCAIHQRHRHRSFCSWHPLSLFVYTRVQILRGIPFQHFRLASPFHPDIACLHSMRGHQSC